MDKFVQKFGKKRKLGDCVTPTPPEDLHKVIYEEVCNIASTSKIVDAPAANMSIYNEATAESACTALC